MPSTHERFDALRDQWETYGQEHFDGEELGALAAELIACSSTAEAVAELPYAFGNWEPTWRQVGRRAIRACERLAREALRRDPQCEAALYLYAQDDFLARVNQARPHGAERIRGAPVTQTRAVQIAKLSRICDLYEEDVLHPLDIPSMETIAVDHAEIVDALLARLATARLAKRELIAALGRTRVEHERVARALARELDHGDRHTIDEVSMAIHYGLKKQGAPAIDALIGAAKRLIGKLTRDESDYRHQWALRAVLMFRADPRVKCALRELLAQIPSMPKWKRQRFDELTRELRAKPRHLVG